MLWPCYISLLACSLIFYAHPDMSSSIICASKLWQSLFHLACSLPIIYLCYEHVLKEGILHLTTVSEYVFDLTIICSHTRGYVNDEQHEDNHTSEHDLSRAQLLEALHHSQTRARIAEIAAQKAYDEKEHIVKLLFRQASHLFAYKQWLRVLQLDNIFLQLKIKDHQIATIIPVLPWMPLKGKLSGKGNITRNGSKKHKRHICKYAVAFAVGLGLAGAGLLLGWTIGCLFPSI